MHVVLSRFRLVGYVNVNMPHDLVAEIADAHDIPTNTSDLILAINTTPPDVVDFRNMGIKDVRKIARFVNDRCSWTMDTIKVAFELLLEDHTLHPGIKTGRQTPEEPGNWNLCRAYAALVKYGIPVDSSSDIYALFHSNMDLMLFRSSLMLRAIDAILPLPPQPLGEETSTQVERMARLYRDRSDAAAAPSTVPEAIAYAAIFHGLDISGAEDAVSEVGALREGPYIPKDRSLASRAMSPYPILHSLRLSEVFNPHLPPSVYARGDLGALSRKEGCFPSYQEMQAISLLPTFFPNIVTGTKNAETYIGDDVSKLGDSGVCYGLRYGEKRAYSYDELDLLFRSNGRFVGVDGDEFPEHAINKLVLLAKKHNAGLLKTITEIRTGMGKEDDDARELRQRYNSSTEETKVKIIRAFQSLLELSMYMRGWSGKGPWPITESPAADFIQTSLRVTKAFLTFDEKVRECGVELESLHIVRYNGGMLALTGERKTIGHKLNAIRSGNGESVNSCIRTSSNFLACSAYYYLEILGKKPEFAVEDLRWIG